jgi:fructose-1,6-bisphosphatase/inositol monophosphatase family enzyme
MHRLSAPVCALIRDVAKTIMMPRFQQLAAHEIAEKTPGDYVTIVDRESEARLTEALAKLLPGSRVVGEEATAADALVAEGIDQGAVWIVDPLDGTANFAAGRRPFAIMVALAIDGVTDAGWIFDPVTGRMCQAAAGRGAYVDGERIRSNGTGRPFPLAALATRFLPDDVRQDIEQRVEGRMASVDIPGCAGEQYPRVALGENDVALFWRALAWDHAPGALFLSEAGGRVARPDGRDYAVGQTGFGLLAAATPRLWNEAAAILFG